MPVVDLSLDTISWPGLDSHFGFNQYVFSAQVEKIKHGKKADKFDGSGLGTGTKNSHVGMKDGDLELDGFAAMRPGQFGDLVNKNFGRKIPLNAWYAMEGLEALSPITFQPSRIYDSSVDLATDEVVKMAVKACAAGAMYDGHILLSPTATLSGASGTGPSLNNTPGGGASANGAAALLHVYAIDGGTTPSLTVTWEHSVDGTTWTTLKAFDPVTTTGSWLIKVPNPTTVNAYMRASWAVTGTPTALQVMCEAARIYSRTSAS